MGGTWRMTDGRAAPPAPRGARVAGGTAAVPARGSQRARGRARCARGQGPCWPRLPSASGPRGALSDRKCQAAGRTELQGGSGPRGREASHSGRPALRPEEPGARGAERGLRGVPGWEHGEPWHPKTLGDAEVFEQENETPCVLKR